MRLKCEIVAYLNKVPFHQGNLPCRKSKPTMGKLHELSSGLTGPTFTAFQDFKRMLAERKFL